jgi:hypothetical protein
VAENKSIEVRYTVLAPNEATAFVAAYQLHLDGAVITGTVTDAGFHINDIETGRKQYLTLTLGNGLTWNDSDKVLTVVILNEQVSFVRRDADYHYEAFVVINNKTETIREGTVTAVRVG